LGGSIHERLPDEWNNGLILEGHAMQDCKGNDISSVTTTVGSPEAANALAREILDRRLAACVQIEDSVRSLYHWKGALCEEAEVRLVIKTLPACEAALQALFASHHPYEVPQFLAVRMSASPQYEQWLRSETAVPPVA
jgi:periplasmic divalent cation tolerance protein